MFAVASHRLSNVVRRCWLCGVIGLLFGVAGASNSYGIIIPSQLERLPAIRLHDDSTTATRTKTDSTTVSVYRDTTSADSVAITDSTNVADSVDPGPRQYSPLKQHGALLLLGPEAYKNIAKRDFARLDYHGLYDIFSAYSPAFPLGLGSQGKFNHLSYFGATPRDVGVYFNGRGLNDPAFGAMNIEQFPVEFIESAEIFIGSHAVILGDNTSGALINLREIRYDTKTPFTRIWYSQAAYEYIGTDGVFSQNIHPQLNITFGYRRQSTDGRFENSTQDAWSLRTALRWSLSNYTNISFSEVFTNHQIETNGGVIAVNGQIVSDPIEAQPQFSILDERVFRHDLTLTLTSYLTGDSSSSLSGAVYLSDAEWNKWRDPDLLTNGDTLRTAKFTTRNIGITGRLETSLEPISLKVGGTAEARSVTQSPYTPASETAALAGFGLAKAQITRHIDISGGVRMRILESDVVVSGGARVGMAIDSNFSVFADVSRSFRTASPVENIATLDHETHVLGLLGLEAQTGGVAWEILSFFRRISNPILANVVVSADDVIVGTAFRQGSSREIAGLHGQARLRIGSVLIKGRALSQYSTTDSENDQRFPAVYGEIEAQYEYKIGKSSLLAGVRLFGLTSFQGEQFIPLTWSYVPTETTLSATGNGIDLIASAVLGNAIVRVGYQNLLNQTYYFVPVNPGPDGNIRVSVSWAFKD